MLTRKNKYTKTEKAINDVITIMSEFPNFTISINQHIINLYDYNSEDKKVEYIFYHFSPLQGTLLNIIRNFNFCMSELEKKYKFNSSWIKTTSYIDDTIKNSIIQMKNQYRQTIISDINQQHRKTNSLNDFEVFLSDLTGVDCKPIINSVRSFIKSFSEESFKYNSDKESNVEENNQVNEEIDKESTEEK